MKCESCEQPINVGESTHIMCKNCFEVSEAINNTLTSIAVLVTSLQETLQKHGLTLPVDELRKELQQTENNPSE